MNLKHFSCKRQNILLLILCGTCFAVFLVETFSEVGGHSILARMRFQGMKWMHENINRLEERQLQTMFADDATRALLKNNPSDINKILEDTLPRTEEQTKNDHIKILVKAPSVQKNHLFTPRKGTNTHRNNTSNPRKYTLISSHHRTLIKGNLLESNMPNSQSKAADQSNNETSGIRIGVLVPSCTWTIKFPNVKNFSLTTILLPTLLKTIEKNYTYKVYIGIDKGDYLETVQDRIKDMFPNLTIIFVISPGHTITIATNTIAERAFNEGMDYFLRITDDTFLKQDGWTSQAISVLRQYKPPNIGVVGPTFHEGNTKILTNDFTHRSHFDIFGFYYPRIFENHYNDDWITEVYKPDRSTKMTNWVVKHDIYYHGTRYIYDLKLKVHLNRTIERGKQTLEEYVERHQRQETLK